MLHLIFALALNSSPALADKAPACGRSSSSYDWDTAECDTGDCADSEGDRAARQVESNGIPRPVQGSLIASVLIIGISARRRFRNESEHD